MTTPTEEAYDVIQRAYDYFNTTLFEGLLPACLITFQRQKRIMGYVSFRRWMSTSRQYVDELAINPEYFANYPVIEICQTLCHEMVHIWQAHFGRPGRRGYHNLEWADKMATIGLIPSSTGEPGGDNIGEHVADYILYDGLFFRACQTLLQQNFALRWVDRYPIYRGEDPVTTYDDQGQQVVLDSEQKPLAMPKFTTQQLKATAIATEELVVREDEEPEIGSKPITLAPSSTQWVNRSNRHKYVCKGCTLQLWGKPGANVICGNCQLTLIEYS